MRPNSFGDARRGARAAACLAFAAALEACAAAGPTARYDSLASELASAHPAPDAPSLAPSTDDPFGGAATLSREALVAAVLDRNPTLRAARHASSSASPSPFPGSSACAARSRSRRPRRPRRTTRRSGFGSRPPQHSSSTTTTSSRARAR